VPIIQWEKDATEDAGLVKIDLLGNRSLGVIRDAIGNLRTNGIEFDDLHWEPEDDLPTQHSLAQGGTMGCFYIESPAMRLLQQKSKVGDFEHLVIHSSIIRPAANEFIREYIRRLHGGPWDPIHPLLAEVLEETFGIMVYQEDVSRAATALAGFSHAEADTLRKVMSKKDRQHQLQDFKKRFYAGAANRNVSEKQITAIWEMMMSFSGYSFCKPHSASYARVSFQAAYLKLHHPAEFMAAVISNRGGFYSTFAYVSESRRLGLTILPPDVNVSEIRWTGRDTAVRVGLLSIKGLAVETQQRIVDHRRPEPYRSLRAFMDRVRPAEDEARALIHCGALDKFKLNPAGNRAALMWQLAGWLKARSTRSIPQNRSLFGDADQAPNDPPPPLPPEDDRERLRREFAILGFLCDRHPMELYAATLHRLRTVKAVDLPRHRGRRVRLAGWLITGKVVTTKNGDPMEFLTFEDETGIVEATFFPRTYHRFCHMIDRQRPYLLTGKVEEDWGAITLTVDKVDGISR
jgi:DNA polymerase-3 subunit alpha/error-prone DNA polymerase